MKNVLSIVDSYVMIRRSFLVLIVATCFWCCDKQSPVLSESSDLKVNQLPEQRFLKENTSDSFKLDLMKGAFIYGYVDQLNLDLTISITTPDDHEFLSFNTTPYGKEYFKFTASESGSFDIIVTSLEKKGGSYAIALRTALSSDPVLRINQILEELFSDTDLTPGVSILVQRDGNILYDRCIGYADIEQKTKINSNTIFHVASVSKQFTAFAIAMLVDQGKISLHDDIRKYLPEMHKFEAPITIDHLIHHTSGLRDQWDLLHMAGWRIDDVITNSQILRLAANQTELNFKPGDEILYSNMGYTLLAEIVARVTHQSFAEWCEENIFTPLEMKNTLFYDDHEKIVINRANSYYHDRSGYKKRTLSYATVGATSLFTTADDLTLWALNFEKVKVGNTKIMATMAQKFILNNGDIINYAFGQVVEKYRGLNRFIHNGGDAGFRSYLLRFPDQNFSVAIVSNYEGFNMDYIATHIADLYLANDFQSPSVRRDEDNSINNEQASFDARTVYLADYAGEYYSPELEATYWFSIDNELLVAHNLHFEDMVITPTKIDGFRMDILGDLDFYREAGKIAGFHASNGRVRNLKFIKRM